MTTYIVLAAMKGRFVSEQGNTYDNFQMLGYMEATSPEAAVSAFFDQAPFPIRWEDVEYMWAERLADYPPNAHYGDYDRIYVESLRRRWDPGSVA
jgi:hypothetical protein